MEKVIRILSKEDAEIEDIKYWHSKTPDERLDAMQVLREQYIYYFNKQDLYNESRKGLRRFYKITKRV
jgi:hypothetical protein